MCLIEQGHGPTSKLLIASATYGCNPQTAFGRWGAGCFHHSNRCEVAGELSGSLHPLEGLLAGY